MLGDLPLDNDTPLMDAGIDSLLAVEVRSRLQTDLHITLPPTCVFDYPTITAILNDITTTAHPTPQPKQATARPPPRPRFAGVQAVAWLSLFRGLNGFCNEQADHGKIRHPVKVHGNDPQYNLFAGVPIY